MQGDLFYPCSALFCSKPTKELPNPFGFCPLLEALSSDIFELVTGGPAALEAARTEGPGSCGLQGHAEYAVSLSKGLFQLVWAAGAKFPWETRGWSNE